MSVVSATCRNRGHVCCELPEASSVQQSLLCLLRYQLAILASIRLDNKAIHVAGTCCSACVSTCWQHRNALQRGAHGVSHDKGTLQLILESNPKMKRHFSFRACCTRPQRGSLEPIFALPQKGGTWQRWRQASPESHWSSNNLSQKQSRTPSRHNPLVDCGLNPKMQGKSMGCREDGNGKRRPRFGTFVALIASSNRSFLSSAKRAVAHCWDAAGRVAFNSVSVVAPTLQCWRDSAETKAQQSRHFVSPTEQGLQFQQAIISRIMRYPFLFPGPPNACG